MRTTAFILAFVGTILLYSCASTKLATEKEYVEHIKEVYRVDSVRDYIHDSIFLYINGDTVYKYQYQYRYIDRLKLDSVYMRDTVFKETPVVMKKNLTQWQIFQIWCGRILIILLVLYVGFKLLKTYLRPI